jgi:hypothetical protein
MEIQMDRNEKSKLIEALLKGTVTVTFEKINDGGIRVMPCTLNPIVLEANGVTPTISNISADTETIAAWALDKEAWRSFIADTVLGWEVL